MAFIFTYHLTTYLAIYIYIYTYILSLFSYREVRGYHLESY